jgi:hypothetical protein
VVLSRNRPLNWSTSLAQSVRDGSLMAILP